MFKLPKPKNTIKTLATVAIAIGGVLSSTVAQAITINITYATDITGIVQQPNQQQITAVEMAKNLVSAYLVGTNATVNIHIGMNSSMSSSYLALATPAIITTKNYSAFTQAIKVNTTSNQYRRLNQDLAVTTNNTSLMMTYANCKVLGIKSSVDPSYGGLDGYIQFNSNITWDYNPIDGISSSQYDMTTIAVHEILHVLGVISGIDPNNVKTSYPTPMDMYRFSDYSKGLTDGPAIDFRQGSSAYLADDLLGTSKNSNKKYFSKGVDTTKGGDGYQTSHWQNNLTNPIGIMNPTQYAGSKNSIKDTDLALLDKIGYVTNIATPDVGALYLLAQGQATSAIVLDKSAEVSAMIADSGVYGTGGSTGGTCTTNCGWWERTAEWEHNQPHDHNH